MFLLSSTGIHIPLNEKGDAVGMFVPSQTATRRFTDIQNPSKGTVKARLSLEGAEQPLWRMFDDRSVEYYGSVAEEITERRASVSIYLPKDFLPEGYNVFYYVFNDRWVVYGERLISDEGAVDWVYSKFDTVDEDLTDFLVGVISDRLVKGVREKICVATHNCVETQSALQESLSPFDIETVEFSSLKLDKVKPIYQHKDFGILMLFGFFCGFVLMVATIGFYAKSYFELSAVQDDIAQIQAEIAQMQSEMVLGHIEDPDDVLNRVKQPKLVKPSSLLHETGEIAAMFGTLDSMTIFYGPPFDMGAGLRIGLDERRREVITTARVEQSEAEMLVDQENVAKAIVTTKEYVREIMRVNSEDTKLNLSVKMQIGETE